MHHSSQSTCIKRDVVACCGSLSNKVYRNSSNRPHDAPAPLPCKEPSLDNSLAAFLSLGASANIFSPFNSDTSIVILNAATLRSHTISFKICCKIWLSCKKMAGLKKYVMTSHNDPMTVQMGEKMSLPNDECNLQTTSNQDRLTNLRKNDPTAAEKLCGSSNSNTFGQI